VQKAVSSVASKLQQFESGQQDAPEDLVPTPTRRFEDFQSFGDPEPYVSPMDAAQPVRAAPLPPRTPAPAPMQSVGDDIDIYFAEDSGDLIIGDDPADAGEVIAAAPPPLDTGDDNDLLIEPVKRVGCKTSR